LQNEYSTWISKDKHAHAFTVLTTTVAAKNMARILHLDPTTAPKCLACHATYVPASEQAKPFHDYSDGVGCESCHGPSSKWLSDHTTRGWTYDKSVYQDGMYDTRDLVKRSEKCLSCHLGNSEKYVDHEMLAAGHPDLYFEQDSFEAVEPRHWKYPPDGDNWIGLRTLAVGQAVQLRESLNRLAFHASGGAWPEYTELDCFACHHSLTSPDNSWRQQRGYGYQTAYERRPGNPPYNLSHYIILEKIVETMEPGTARQLQGQIDQIYKQVGMLQNNRAEIASMAKAASSGADDLAHKLQRATFDTAWGVRLMKSISADDNIPAQGERSAEQAAMALQSLFVATCDNAHFRDIEQLRSTINSLFAQFQTPSAYDQYKFAKQLHSVSALL
jgi:hypothetical protein